MQETNSCRARSQGFKGLLWILCLMFIAIPLYSEDTPPNKSPIEQPSESPKQNPVKVALISENTTIQPGNPFWVAIRLEIKDDWHAYWKNPGGIGLPPSIKWQLPEGFEVSELYWPFPERLVVHDEVNYVYRNEVWLLAKVIPPATLPTNSAITLFGNVDWLVCSDMNCLPGKDDISLKLRTSKESPEVDAQWEKQFAEAREKLPRKHPQDTPAYLKDGNLVISVPKDITSAGITMISSISFFPEKGGMVDIAVEPILHRDGSDSSDYHVILKAKEANETHDIAKNQVLKGTLVFHTEKDDVDPPEAWEMDMPIVASIESGSAPQEMFVAMLFAFLGGLLLNLMPCVLPVISLKILSFVKLAKEKRSLILKHGILFSFGVLISFWTLAGVLLILQAYGEAVGWGFQLQDSLFVAVLSALLFIFALNFFGVYEIGTIFASWAGQKQHSNKNRGHLFGSFLSGVLATAVATPCTGPFLGSAVGFAVTLPAPQAMMIFTILGLGMAFPYLILSSFPNLIRWIPKPGPWMVTFKEVMGFFMMATVLWLVWVFGAQTNFSAVSILLAGMLFLAVACWTLGKWSSPIRTRLSRIFGYVVALTFSVAAIYAISFAVSPQFSAPIADKTIAMTSHGEAQGTQEWEPFSMERVNELQKKGIPVFIDFTARWCLICQTNHLVLSTSDVQKKFRELGVVTMKADWTKNDPAITKLLRKFGRSGVPLYVLYGTDPKESPTILPQVLTPDNVIESLGKIKAVETKQESETLKTSEA